MNKKSLLQRIREWICRKFGHSFSSVDMLIFNIERRGGCYIINLLNGEARRSDKVPEICCERCGEVFIPKE